jgi:hypothetical protein
MGAFYNKIPTDSGSYSSGLQLSFCLFLVIGHVTIIPISHQMDPDGHNHPYLVFLHFLVKQSSDFYFWMYANDPDMDPESSAP